MSLHLFNAFLLQQPLPDIDANAEGNAMTWASTVATAAVAIAALLDALITGPRLANLGLALTTGFLSLDDMISLHERLSTKLLLLTGLDPAWDSVLWPVLLLPALVMITVLIVHMAAAGTRATMQHALAGLCLLALAVLSEVLSAPWSTGANPVRTIQGGFEEALELAGWMLVASSLFLTLVARAVRQAADPGQPVARK